MSYLSKVGSFNIDTTKTVGQSQSIDGVGFQPKIVLFWWSGSTASSDTVAGGTFHVGFGAGISSSSMFCSSVVSEDGQTDSDALSSQRADRVIEIYTDTATVDGYATFASQDTDGFTITIGDQFSNAYRISYLALGGTDLTNVFIGNKQRDADTGNCSVTGVGFQPDAVIFAGNVGNSASVAANGGFFHIGMATGSSNQGVAAIYIQDAQTTTNTASYGYNGESAVRLLGNPNIRDAFVSLDSDGFTLNQLEGTTQYYYYFIALKGGQYSVGDLTTRTDGNDIAETVGFQPVALLFASANKALSTQDAATPHARLSIGAGTSTSNRAVQAISDEDNLGDSETAYANYDSAVYANIADDAIVGLMDLKSVESDGFTCVMDDADPSECWVTYLAIGAESGESCVNIVNVTEIVSTTTPVVVVDICEP